MIENKYKSVPFWSWNDELDEQELVRQIEWMHNEGMGGFFMHARGGLTTPYLGEKWFSCIRACLKKAKELDMEAYAYDENGWPSGFAGGKLLEDENNRDCYLTFNKGPYDKNAFASFSDDGQRLTRVFTGDEVINIYKHIATSTADICDEKVVRKFIELTHEQYKKHDIYGNLRGFFTDEPQYYRWGTPYTNRLEAYFLETYGQDIRDFIGLIFFEREGYRDFRYKYWLSLQHLMLHSFGKQVYDWCDENGYQLTGHYVEESSLAHQMMCCAGIMPFYQYLHIPGIDWLSRRTPNDMTPKQVGSVAAQLGKKQVLTETFACAGWNVSPKELKHIAEMQYVGGVNLQCQHLVPYSEHGQRKRDYPPHFAPINPWIEDSFKEFNDYFSYLGKLLSQSIEKINTAILHPIRSGYFNYKRDKMFESIADLDQAFSKLLQKVNALQIPHHFVDETVMEEQHAFVKEGRLHVGLCAYEFIILPKLLTMGKYTNALLEEFVKQGGKLILMGDKPTYLEGTPHQYDYLSNSSSITELLSSLDFTATENENIRSTYRLDQTGNPFFFIVNKTNEEQEITIKVKGFSSFICNDEVIGQTIKLQGWESRIIYPSNKKVQLKKKRQELRLSETFKVGLPVDNFLILDKIQYSKNGRDYSKPHLYMGIFNQLLLERYEGDLYLKYTFEVKDLPSRCFALIEDTRTKEVVINGQTIQRVGTVLEKDLWKFALAKHLKKGQNEIIVRIDYYQSEDVYYALFGENVTESLKNCLAYSTTIEAIYLMGDFGVYGDFKKGKVPNCYLGNNFYLGRQKDLIKSTVLDGFPFMRGKLTLKQQVEIADTHQELVIDSLFQTIEVKVNGQEAGKMMFSNRLDLSPYLKIGTNEIELVLTLSNRNLLGPSHDLAEDPDGVGPHTFEQIGTWVDGDSSHQLDDYALMEGIV